MSQIRAKQIKLNNQGDIILGDASSNGSVLPIGSSNQVLISNGSTLAYGYITQVRSTLGNVVIDTSSVSGSVNNFTFSRGTTGNGPEISATGSDTNIDIKLTTKGTGEVLVPTSYTVVSDNALTTKQYVDSVATGLDFKNSVRAATTTDLASSNATFSYNATNDEWTAPDGGFVIDGVTIADGDRVLVKNENDAGGDNRGHGIWVYDDASDLLVRSSDADNTPENEVSGGMFTFVEEGTVQADTGWVLENPNGQATLGTDDLEFVQFSSAGVITAGNGLTKSGTTLDVNTDGITTYIDTNDDVSVKSSNTANQVLLSDGGETTPAWGALPLDDTNAVTNILSETNGGTGESSYSEGDLLVGDAGGGITLLSVVDGSGDQVLQYNDSTNTVEWTAATNIGGLSFGTVTADSGTNAAADTTSDTLAITGGTGITTTSTDDPESVTIDMDVNGLTSETTVDTANDTLVFYDDSASEERKTTVENIFTEQGVGVPASDEATASGATNETFVGFFSNTPISDDSITVYFNGLALRQTGWTRSGLDLTLNDSVNGYSTDSGDIIHASYQSI